MAQREQHSPVAIDAELPGRFSRVVRFLISLIFYAVSEGWDFVRRAAGKSRAPRIVVIYYHHVIDEHRERLRHQLDHLVRWTTPMHAGRNQVVADGSRYAVVTMDDGWLSFARNAIPQLALRNIPVAIFAISDRLGQVIDNVAFDRLLNADELRGLDPTLVTIGSHTATHARMTTLDEPNSFRELHDSREKLSQLLGREVNAFCFPYGEYNHRLIDLCREAGYERVFTCDAELANPGDFAVGRVRVDPTDWPLEFHLKLMGAYRWLPTAISLKRRLMAPLRGRSRIAATSISAPS